MNSSEVVGKVVVITGASSGFGKGTALALAREGAKLVLAARRDAVLEDLARQCADQGGEAIAEPVDVSHSDEVAALGQAAVRRFGRFDVWINNAGVGALGPFERIPLEDHVQVIETNLLGTLYGSWVAYRQFLAQGFGTLINIASELGKHTVPYYTSYSASKHGIVGLDDSLRQEILLRKLDDIHVCTVMPTAHDTPFFDHAANYSGHVVTPPKPLHDPADVVDALVKLVKRPKDRKVVGADGIVKILMKNLMPGIAENLAARAVQKQQIDDAPPDVDSPGAVRTPMAKGTSLSGGRIDGHEHLGP